MKPVVEQLENGLKVVLAPNSASPVIAFQMWVAVGSADEMKGEEGLAHVFEHMLFKGTAKREVGEIARDVERAGGQINAWTSHDETVFHITLASRYGSQGLDILADAIQHPALDQEELSRELPVILEEIRMGEDSPERCLAQRLFNNVFKKHPYGRPVIGYSRTVRKFTREMVVDFYKRWYTADNMTFVVSGDFESRNMLKRIAAAFGDLATRPVPDRSTRCVEPAQRRPRVAWDVRHISEAHIAIGYPVPGLTHGHTPSLDLLAAVLGQGMSARLETRIRRDQGLVTGIRSMNYTPKDAGIFGVFATVPPTNLERATRAILREIDRVALDPVQGEELDKAKILIESDKVYSEETVDGIARKLGFYGLHVGDVTFENKYLAAVASKEPDDLREVARRYLVPSSASLAAVVPDVSGYAKGGQIPWVTGRGSKKQLAGEKLTAVLLNPIKKTKKPGALSRTKSAPSVKTTVCELGTGDVLVVRAEPGARLVSARSAFLGGSRMETDAEAGISALLANAITRGTGDLSALDIARQMDALACAIGGFSGRNTIGMYGEFLRRNFEKGLSLMGACLRNPSFPEKEVTREKELLIEEIRASLTHPAQQAFKLFYQALYGQHPYSRPVFGYEETVAALEAAVLKRHLRRVTKPGAMVMSVVGDVDVVQIRDLVDQHFVLDGRRKQRIKPPSPWKPLTSPVQVTHSLTKEQSHLIMGFPGARITDADRYAVDMLIEILGGHGGRLFEAIREKKGLAYSVTAFSLQGIEHGHIALYAATSPGNEVAVAQAMLAEVAQACQKPPQASELLRVKRHLVGARSIAWQRTSTKAANVALDVLYGNGHNEAERFATHIDKVTRASVWDAANCYLRPERRVVACVGPDVENLSLL